jgi:hypothetical protein
MNPLSVSVLVLAFGQAIYDLPVVVDNFQCITGVDWISPLISLFSPTATHHNMLLWSCTLQILWCAMGAKVNFNFV